MNTIEQLQAQWLEGVQLLKAGQHEQAYYRFKAITDQDPNCAPALAGLANVYYETFQPRKAWDCAQKAAEILPNNGFILGISTQIALRLGKFDDAKHYATRAYKLAPKSPDGIKAYLLYLQSAGEAQKVERLARELLAIDKSSTSRLTAGTALETTGKTIEAIRIYRNGIRDILAAKSPPPHTKGLKRD